MRLERVRKLAKRLVSVKTLLCAALAAIACVYFLGILYINISRNPSFYSPDMYSDICYAMKAWEEKSLFPEGWVFGNQVYVAATPVLAALFYGITSRPVLAMAAAATLMGFACVASFSWMLKPAFSKTEDRLLCIVIFMSLPLFCGDAIRDENGWQLLFTMCSYYACYAITTFLAFGCYIRFGSGSTGRIKAILALTCLLSFAMGIQSLRQTAVMAAPLLAAAALQMIVRVVRRETVFTKQTGAALAVSGANVLGVVCKHFLPIRQTEIFGKVGLSGMSEILSGIRESGKTLLSLFGSREDPVLLLCVLLACLLAVGLLIYRMVKSETSDKEVLLFALMGMSVLAVWGAEVFTTMSVRGIYYFMLYPLVAMAVVYVYSGRKTVVRLATVGVLAVTLLYPCGYDLYWSCVEADSAWENENIAISDYLLDNGYTTVFSAWNHGEDVAIASNCQIQAGFWITPDRPFESVRYLCDPSIYDAEPEKCAYLFRGEAAAEIGVAEAESQGTELGLLNHFPESDTYVYAASENLMR